MNAPLPGFWRNETTGVLTPAIEAFLAGSMTQEQVAVMRAYLRQWIAGGFIGPAIEDLRRRVDGLTTHGALARWVADAVEAGADPL